MEFIAAKNAKAGELMNYNHLTVFTDGGSRGNPGPCAVGVYIVSPDGEELKKHCRCIGQGTNNIAEYTALLDSLKILKDYSFESVEFKLDSELVVKQINGIYKIKDEKLKGLFEEIKEYLDRLKANYQFSHVRREENKIADSLVNKALDESCNP